MARPIAWLRRLNEIRSTIATSTQPLYGRRDLERVFKISSRAASKLLASLPNTPVGKSLLVERQELLAYLKHVAAAANSSAAVLDHRAATPREKAGAGKTRQLSYPLYAEKASFDDLPENMTLEPGRVTLRFNRLEELLESLKWLSLLLSDNINLWSFVNRFEPSSAPAATEQSEETLAELRDAETIRN